MLYPPSSERRNFEVFSKMLIGKRGCLSGWNMVDEPQKKLVLNPIDPNLVGVGRPRPDNATIF